MSLRLKFELLCRGIAPSSTALGALPSYSSGAVVVRDYPTTSGLVLRLPGELFVNARVRFDSAQAFPLEHDGSDFLLHAESETLSVDVFPPAQYAIENRRLASGKSIRVVANTHADR